MTAETIESAVSGAWHGCPCRGELSGLARAFDRMLSLVADGKEGSTLTFHAAALAR